MSANTMDLGRVVQQLGIFAFVLFMCSSHIGATNLDSSKSVDDDVNGDIQNSLGVWVPLRRSLFTQDLQGSPRTWGAFRNQWTKRAPGPDRLAPSSIPLSRWRSATAWMPVSDVGDLRSMERTRKQSDNWNSLKGYWG